MMEMRKTNEREWKYGQKMRWTVCVLLSFLGSSSPSGSKSSTSAFLGFAPGCWKWARRWSRSFRRSFSP